MRIELSTVRKIVVAHDAFLLLHDESQPVQDVQVSNHFGELRDSKVLVEQDQALLALRA